jgi:hypothetical protein
VFSDTNEITQVVSESPLYKETVFDTFVVDAVTVPLTVAGTNGYANPASVAMAKIRIIVNIFCAIFDREFIV